MSSSTRACAVYVMGQIGQRKPRASQAQTTNILKNVLCVNPHESFGVLHLSEDNVELEKVDVETATRS
jgi:hypothetical protein